MQRSKVDAARGHVGGLVRSMRFGPPSAGSQGCRDPDAAGAGRPALSSALADNHYLFT
jgi:hypothetical protein